MVRASNPWYIVFALLVCALTLAVAGLLIVTLHVGLLIFAGVLFGVFLNGLSTRLGRLTPLPYRGSYAVVLLLVLALSVGASYYVGSQAITQVSELSQALRDAAGQFADQLQRHDWINRQLRSSSQQQLQRLGAMDLLPPVLRSLSSLGWILTAALVIFFVGVYVAYDPELYKSGIIKLVPPVHRGRALEVLKASHADLERWLLGRFMSMALVGIATTMALYALQVPLPLALGVLAALLTFLPNLGPLIAIVPQALLAMQVGLETAVYVMVFNLVLQTVESYLFTPLIQQHEANLPPALTILAQLLMGVLLGIVGVAMAAPLTVVCLVLTRMLYVEEHSSGEAAAAGA